jgi:hypothetical protein
MIPMRDVVAPRRERRCEISHSDDRAGLKPGLHGGEREAGGKEVSQDPSLAASEITGILKGLAPLRDSRWA